MCPEPQENAKFGSSVAIHGNTIAIGCPSLKRVYLFEYQGNWVQIAALEVK